LIQSFDFIVEFSQLMQLVNGNTENDTWFIERTLLCCELAPQSSEVGNHNDVPDLGRGYDHFAVCSQKIHGLMMCGPIPSDAPRWHKCHHIVGRGTRLKR
jgi:hypothetical protein